ncbi:glycosyltransferase [Neobacillus mesonae]|uniref:glycosyltransferase n=1 Tax=Neobacillus mesonae TaxID=1193713 RepID=UPI0025735E68|nr:glycosyltransferase [Neobacillus mesonae]
MKRTFDKSILNEVAVTNEAEVFQVTETLGFKTAEGVFPYPSCENFNFINMGRLSPEKAQDNLIKAFASFHQNVPNSKLYILGGGPLRKDLEDLIREVQVEDSVYLVGQVENPFKIMKKCDCFVLSSHYEGQPMVLLEALTLGMKIVATDIVANRTVLEKGKYGLLVENSIEGLKTGLLQAVENETVGYQIHFKPEDYNQKAIQGFKLIWQIKYLKISLILSIIKCRNNL